jgi:hypothetical protein
MYFLPICHRSPPRLAHCRTRAGPFVPFTHVGPCRATQYFAFAEPGSDYPRTGLLRFSLSLPHN